MDADDVEAAVGAGGFIKHALEGGPPIVCRRGSRLDKFLGDCPAPSLAKRRVRSRCDGMETSPAA
jgi:hypothetical protein